MRKDRGEGTEGKEDQKKQWCEVEEGERERGGRLRWGREKGSKGEGKGGGRIGMNRRGREKAIVVASETEKETIMGRDRGKR